VDRRAIYRKTRKGLSEITGRDRTVDRRLRPLLILVDGYRTATHIHSLIGGIGIREEDFDHLIAGGFIEAISLPKGGGPRPGTAANDPGDAAQDSSATIQKRSAIDRYTDGKRYLTETAAERLGIWSFMFVLKLEKCSSPEDLMALVPEFEEAIGRKLDKSYARHCRQIAESILRD
jgi:hypothetical protein